jgi:hypothetical protein
MVDPPHLRYEKEMLKLNIGYPIMFADPFGEYERVRPGDIVEFEWGLSMFLGILC